MSWALASSVIFWKTSGMLASTAGVGSTVHFDTKYTPKRKALFCRANIKLRMGECTECTGAFKTFGDYGECTLRECANAPHPRGGALVHSPLRYKRSAGSAANKGLADSAATA
jgi:hypothetical protein